MLLQPQLSIRKGSDTQENTDGFLMAHERYGWILIPFEIVKTDARMRSM